jgi:hypothetical protein
VGRRDDCLGGETALSKLFTDPQIISAAVTLHLPGRLHRLQASKGLEAEANCGSLGFPGFPVEGDFIGEGHAPLFTESRIRGRGWQL